LKIAENLDLCQEARDNAISFLTNAIPRKFPDLKTIPTTKPEIKSTVNSLRAEKLYKL
jgi:hypothetical protein